MSTTINVTVGGNGLLDQSRQQMQANRFGRLERDQDSNTHTQASEQLAEQQASNQPSGRLPQARRSTPEPAANRRTAAFDVVLEPSTSYGQYGLAAKVKGNIPVEFIRYFLYDDEPYASIESVFTAGAGPNGTNALVISTIPQPGRLDYYQQAQFALSKTRGIQALSSSNVINGITYPAPTGVGPISYDGNFGGYAVIDGTGVLLQSPPGLEKVNQWTLEMYVRLNDGLTTDPDATYTITASCNYCFLSVEGSYNQDLTAYQRFDYGLFGWTDQSFQSPGHTAVRTGSSGPDAALPDNQWAHLAICSTATTVSFFLNGELLKTEQFSGYTKDPNPAKVLGGTITLYGRFGAKPALHGYRFTPRAIYTASFTPPASITTFA